MIVPARNGITKKKVVQNAGLGSQVTRRYIISKRVLADVPDEPAFKLDRVERKLQFDAGEDHADDQQNKPDDEQADRDVCQCGNDAAEAKAQRTRSETANGQ